ncbi:MAG: hypothetical protein HUU50_04215 [Candidatus Brocadiae bacterium]|nr:hypothetical protein [Candidatus Brocadiia bacterium]
MQPNPIFVAMPFSDEMWPVWEIIEAAVHEAGGKALRVDMIPQLGNIHEAIFHSIENSDVVIGDFTGMNTNVAMEVQHARANNKPIILITQNDPKNLPFDLRIFRSIVYQNNNDSLKILKKRLKDAVQSNLEYAMQNSNKSFAFSSQSLQKPVIVQDFQDIDLAIAQGQGKKAAKKNFQKAIEIAQKIECPDERGLALVDIASNVAKAGKLELVVTMLEKNEDYKDDILDSIASALAEAEEFHQAIVIAEKIDCSLTKLGTMGSIASSLIKVGGFQQTLEIVKKICDNSDGDETFYDDDNTLNDIVLMLIEAGGIEEAISIAENIKDSYYKGHSFVAISSALGISGNFEKAIDLAEKTDVCWKARALSPIALSLAKAGDRERASQIFQRAIAIAEENEGNSYLLDNIASALADAGYFQQAISIAKSSLREIALTSVKARELDIAISIAKKNETDYSLLNGIASALAEVSYFNQAITIAQKIVDESIKFYSLGKIALALAKAGDFHQAIGIAEKIEDEFQKSEALVNIASAMVEAKEIKKAREIFQQAIAIVENTDDEFQGSKAFANIAYALAKASYFHEAIDVVRKIEAYWEKSQVLAFIGLALLEQIEGKKSETEGTIELLKIHVLQNWLKNQKKWHNRIVISARYVGEVKDGLPSGIGKCKFILCKSVFSNESECLNYEGTWVSGMPNGQGIRIWVNGDFKGQKYEGNFKDGMYHGKGVFTWPDGSKYEGNFKDGMYDGQGTLVLSNGPKYVGERKNNLYNGYGILTLSDGTEYEGEWKDGKFNGQGTLMSPDGLKYVGEWREGAKNGYGTLTWPNGSKYVGEFKDNKFNGDGILYDKNVQIIKNGIWKDDKYICNKLIWKLYKLWKKDKF